MKPDGCRDAVERAQTHLSLLLPANDERELMAVKPLLVVVFAVMCLLRDLPAMMVQ